MSRNNAVAAHIDVDIRESVDTETLRAIVNEQYARHNPGDLRALLMSAGEQVWSNEELLDDFEAEVFNPPYVTVIRKSDGVRGTVAFVDFPRLYFHFRPSQNHDTKQPKAV